MRDVRSGNTGDLFAAVRDVQEELYARVQRDEDGWLEALHLAQQLALEVARVLAIRAGVQELHPFPPTVARIARREL